MPKRIKVPKTRVRPEPHPIPTPEEIAMSGRREPPHSESPTSIAAEALRSGIFPEAPPPEQVPTQDEVLRAGDPDVSPLSTELYGEEVGGASMPTPDQANVDELGKLYGIADVDNGSLVMAEELLTRRDEKREEIDPDSRLAAHERRWADEATPARAWFEPPRQKPNGHAKHVMPIRMFKGEHLTIAAPMPGILPEGITVELTANGTLILDGKLPRAEDDPKHAGHLKGRKQALLDEWNVGPYRREILLPAPVDATGAVVTYGNGVLVVVLPFAEEIRPARLKLARVRHARGINDGHAMVH